MGRVSLIGLLRLRFPEKGERELSAAVLRGHVSVDGRVVLKPGALVHEGALTDLRDDPPYVSRGGEKLAHALKLWGVQVAGKVLLDAGCSTGGFTDCLLKHGAVRVYSVDVGFNQIDWRLRQDHRVVVMERTNVMSLRPGELSPPPDLAVGDLSFRSLRGAAAHILELATERQGILLAKPQFEWRTPSAGFRGVVEDSGVVRGILFDLLADLRDQGVWASAAAASPVRGRKGNREFLLHLHRGEGPRGYEAGTVLERLVLE